MKVINAYWEKRNLGLRVCEILFEQDEKPDLITLSNLEDSYDYLVAKIPCESVSLVHILEGLGFRYLENQQTMYFAAEEFFNLDKAWMERFPSIKCEKISDIDVLNIVCDKIQNGLYIRGRISSDPGIKKGVSDLRIVNWLKDLFRNDNASVYSLLKDGTIIGYFAMEKINSAHLNIVQAGIFREYQNKGFSFLLLYFIMKNAVENGFKGIFASISTGNMKTFNSISKFVHITLKHAYIVMRKRKHTVSSDLTISI